MARTTRKPSKSKSGGSTLFGLLAGLLIGLVAAVGVALFVTKAPMPFVDHASRDPAKTLLPDVRDAPDPNLGLYGSDNAAGVPPTGPTITAPVPLPGVNTGVAPPDASAPKPGKPAPDDLGKLIANLDKVAEPSPIAKPAAPGKPGAVKEAAPANTQTVYYLQAGAFRSENDAESVKARILLMGLSAEVQKAQANGSTINRVRVGPFKGIDAMNRARARLGEEKIESSVARP
jgi:cell division protein FtsN